MSIFYWDRDIYQMFINMGVALNDYEVKGYAQTEPLQWLAENPTPMTQDDTFTIFRKIKNLKIQKYSYFRVVKYTRVNTKNIQCKMKFIVLYFAGQFPRYIFTIKVK